MSRIVPRAGFPPAGNKRENRRGGQATLNSKFGTNNGRLRVSLAPERLTG